MDWFENGKVKSTYMAQLEQLRDCLQVGGRTAAQGALAWLWAHADQAIPIPGFRNALQVAENAEALAYGPLPPETMQEIEVLMDRRSEQVVRER